jgi:signal transduction histidine kinase/ActR/RegA family two-component response regulator
MFLHRLDNERVEAEFNRRASDISSVLNDGIKDYAIAMDTLQNVTELSLKVDGDWDLTSSEDSVSVKERWDYSAIWFNQMARDNNASFPGFIGLGWVVPSTYEDLEQYETVARFLVSPDYEIRQVTDQGAFVSVEPREMHFPIFYIEPMESTKVALGIDLASGESLRSSIVEAIETGKMVSTSTIEWIRQRTGQIGFLAFDATYYDGEPIESVDQRRERISSIAFGIILVDSLFESSLGGMQVAGLDYFIFEKERTLEEPVASNTPVYSSSGKPESLEVIRESATHSNLESVHVIDVLGREWLLHCFPNEDFHSEFLTTGPLIAFAGGCALSLVVVILLFQMLGKSQRVAALVNQRTQELSDANTKLVQEIESREVLESQLLQTQKMESVGQLAGGVAHDFNNLLQAILGYGEMATEKADKDAPIRKDLGHLLYAAGRAKVLVSQLLAFSRQQVLDMSYLNIEVVIRELVNMVQPIIGEQITLNLEFEHEVGVVHADRVQIEQILLNLCVNARDAMGDGGTLEIRTDNAEFDDDFCSENAWANPGSYVVLSVSDTGEGMDQATQQRIFDPFFTTKEQGKGTGLGLSTVFGLVRQHNGMVDVDSEVGVGTTFRVYLPAIGTIEPTPKIPAQQFSGGGTETILVADDDDMVRDLAEAMLTDAGYNVLTAIDGEDAIRLVDEHAEEIDLALLDVVMPKLGGKAVYEHIEKRCPHISVLFSTGYSPDATHTNFILDEGSELLQKPYVRGELLLKIRAVMGTHMSNP